ncbi:MAG TPA: tail fiber domain-containing protein [Vicinamibacterales bacterium]|jgi:hypothetical protein
MAYRRSVLIASIALLAVACSSAARADEIWVSPTYQQDVGGLGIASSVIWPVSAVGAARLAWPVPNNLQSFQSGKVVVIPSAPGGAATLHVFVCAAKTADAVTGNCGGPFDQPFTGVADHLSEVDITTALAANVVAPGANYLAVVAWTTPTTTSDHIVGLRFRFAPSLPAGVPTLAANTFTGTQAAPAFAGDGTAVTGVNAARLGGLLPAAFAPAAHGHDVAQISNAARTNGSNTLTGTQTLNSGNLDVDHSTTTSGVVFKDGVRFLHDAGSESVYLGKSAGAIDIPDSLRNTGVGESAMGLINNSGLENTAVGYQALITVANGSFNTAIGSKALDHNVGGVFNVAVGRLAGTANDTGSNNIYLGTGTSGVAGENNTMYLGRIGSLTKTFIAGVRGTTTVNANAIPVMIDSAGQLGTVSSSIRFKEDVHDMADASRRLLELRPVTFRYTTPYGDGSKPVQFGLVAEEVADVFPELAVRNADGRVETVHYEVLNVLLLNELKRLREEVDSLRHQVEEHDGRR